MLCVCSTASAAVLTQCGPGGRTIAAAASASSTPPGEENVRVATCPCTAAAASSKVTTCASASQSSSVPGGTSSRTAIWFPIDPDGTNSAASCPNSAATSACSAFTVGSS